MNLKGVKVLTLLMAGAAAATAGMLFKEHREYKEAVVPSAALTQVKKLSDYFPEGKIKGTINDANVYFFDSGVPGGTALIIGGTHPEEPVAVMAATAFTENVKVTQGRVIIIDRINTSGSTVTRLGEAYPRFFHVKTDWGVKKWRYGDRSGNPLDSWPDPEVYISLPQRPEFGLHGHPQRQPQLAGASQRPADGAHGLCRHGTDPQGKSQSHHGLPRS